MQATPAWRTPWTEEHGGLQSIGLQRAGHDRSDLAHIHTCLFSKTHLIAVKYWFRGPRHRLVVTPDFPLEEKYELPLLLNTSNSTKCYHCQMLLFQQALSGINCINLFLSTKVLHSTFYLSGTGLKSSTVINSIF